MRAVMPVVRDVVEGDLYRPAGAGWVPGIVVCLGVAPVGVDPTTVRLM